MQLLIPRMENNINSAKVLLSKKNVYNIKTNDTLKEVVLNKNNKPKLVNYSMEVTRGFCDYGRGQKGRFYVPSKNYDVVVM